MTPLLRHLGNTLDPLPPAATAAAQAATRRLLGKGEPLLRAGERWQQLWWVEAGCLRLYYLDRNGQASNKNFHTDQALLWPITPALREQPVHFWVEATEATTVWALPWAPWSAAVADLPAWQALERRVLALLLEDKMAREHAFCNTRPPSATSNCSSTTPTGPAGCRCATWPPTSASPMWPSRASAAG
ncbi:MAG: cyclic nucleotide-binding domain-containing protein [Burkholderiaceae bacterium]